jgi:hypothetical protein
MSGRIGVAIDSQTVRAVEVRAGRIRWAAELARDESEPLAATLAQLFSDVRKRSRWFIRPRVVLALGPTVVQAKRLSGLPTMRDANLLTRMVAESSGRFFLRNGVPLVTGDVWMPADGGVWAAAADEHSVRDLVEACVQARVVLRSIVPSVVVLGSALQDGAVCWPDGAAGVSVTLAQGELVKLRWMPAASPRSANGASRTPGEGATDEPVARTPLLRLGKDAWRYAAAYGAACTTSPRLDLLPSQRTLHVRVPRWRMELAMAAAAFALAMALVAPGFRAMRAAHRAERELAALERTGPAAEAPYRELEHMSSALEEVSAFAAERRSYTSLLAQLTRAFPAQSAVVSLRVDSAGGTLVALAPHAADVVRSVEHVPAMVNPQIVGPVTSERDGDYDVERVTVSFLWR